MMILLDTKIKFARSPALESFHVNMLAQDYAMNAKLEISPVSQKYKKSCNLASMLKRYYAKIVKMHYASMYVGKYLAVVTIAKSIAQIGVMTQNFHAKKRSIKICHADIMSKLTVTRNRKMLNAIVNAHSFFLVDTNV